MLSCVKDHLHSLCNKLLLNVKIQCGIELFRQTCRATSGWRLLALTLWVRVPAALAPRRPARLARLRHVLLAARHALHHRLTQGNVIMSRYE